MNYDKQKSIKIEQERLNLKLKKQKEQKAEKDKKALELRRIKEKSSAMNKYVEHKLKDQNNRDKIEADKTERGQTRIAEDEARQNRERDDKMNLTPRQKRHKYMNNKDLVRELNKEAEEETDRMLNRLNLSKFKTNIEDLT